MKILIIRFSSIGDIVLTSPVIRALKSQDKNHLVHYATKKKYRNVLSANPYIDHLHLLDGSLFDFTRKLQHERYDLIIDLHNNLRTLFIKLWLRVRSSSFKKLNVRKWLTVNFKWNVLPGSHVVDRYMATLKPLGITGDPLGLDYFIPEQDEVDPEWLPEPFRQKFVVVSIGGKYFTKKLPVKRLIELCDKINQPVVLIGGGEDRNAGDEIERFFQKGLSSSNLEKTLTEGLGKKTIVFNGCGKFNLNQSASLVRQSLVVFTHDTGIMHIAAAFKKKIYTIWGNTIPEFGMYPYRTQFVIFENKKLNCRPCSKIGYDRCPRKHFKCMKDIIFDFYIPD